MNIIIVPEVTFCIFILLFQMTALICNFISEGSEKVLPQPFYHGVLFQTFLKFSWYIMIPQFTLIFKSWLLELSFFKKVVYIFISS